MKVLYLITKANWGGAQRHVFDLAIAMKERGHTPVVALGGDGELRKRLEDVGIKVHSLPSLMRDVSLGLELKATKEIFLILKRERPDVLHLHSAKAAGLGALCGVLLRTKKVVYTIHGFAFNEDRSMYQKIGIVLATWLNLLLVDRVVVLSKKELGQAENFPLVKEKLSLIYPGIRPPIFVSLNGAKDILAKIIGIPPQEYAKKQIVGTIAELHPNKGLFYLLQAIERVVADRPNTITIIIGEGELKPALLEEISRRGLEGKVFITGYIPNASEILKGFSIFALSSVKEGMPYVLIEAGYASLPTVATTVGGIPEIIEDMGSGVLVQEKNPIELAHAISYLLEHAVLSRKYGSALREKVIRDFDVEKMIGETEKLYQA